MDPKFRKKDGCICLFDSEDAKKVKAEKRPWTRALSPDEVKESAREAVEHKGGDPNNEEHVLGQHKLQFGAFRDQTFKWLAENALGYAGYVVASMSVESGRSDSNNNQINKRLLEKYVSQFPAGRYAIRVKKDARSSQPATTASASTQAASTSQQPSASLQAAINVAPAFSPRSSVVPVSSLRGLLSRRDQSPQAIAKNVKSLFTKPRFQPSIPALPRAGSIKASSAVTVKTEPTDSELMQAAAEVDPDTSQSRICLPAGWIPALPEVDQHWISKALFRWSPSGQPEFEIDKVDRMWWYPPQQSLTSSAIPAMEQFFGHPLFLWMPRKLWRVRLLCPHQDCGKAELTSAGLHQRVRLVVGVSGSYYLVAEYLACKSCKRKVISWSHNIVSQLDIGHRLHFPCLLTYKLGCDMQVVRMMRQRGLGNSSSQLQKQLEEQHAESWLGKTIQFLTAYRGVARAISSGLILPVPLGDLPVMPAVPKHRWLMQVYAQDVLGRLDEVKASITSLFGQVLKMDSTKKIVRKLAGQARSTASWATNVGNEHGHVLMSVLTASEGWGLMKMAEGLVRRYKDAGVPPPEILYVDRDCCGNSHLLKIFGAWPGMKIRLDIWHFMRRFATGCTTDSHALYTSFMAQLSRCIFAWDQSDLQLLKAAKRAELEASHLRPTVEDVARHISKAETMLHCRRAVRESGEMGDLLKDLIEAYSGEKGCNTLGVPLINRARMAEILKAQLKHLPCLQDPPGFQLYTQTGTLKKAGHVLPTYRCARGSTSLESFHLHMNRFIPGTLASDTFFQAYLVDGLFRWNEDRTITAEGTEGPRSYSGLLKHAANQLSEEVLGRKLVEYTAPRKYTGELIGIEYLYNQNNAVMEDYKLALLPVQPLLCQLPVQPLLCQLPPQPLLCQLPVQPLLCQLPVQPLLCQLPVQPLLCQLPVQPLLCQLPVQPLLCQLPLQPLLCQLPVQPLLCQLPVQPLLCQLPVQPLLCQLPVQPLLCQLPVQPLLCQLPLQPLLCQLPVQPLLCQLPVQPLLCQLPLQPLLCQLPLQPLLCQLHSLQLLRLPLCIVLPSKTHRAW
ncbi:unnamed protein product [Arctogadus glacialis]